MATFSGSSSDDIFTGGIENDSASGAGGNDRLSGADGSDTLAGGAGADTLEGGAGDDVLYSGAVPPAFNLPYAGNSYTLPQLDTGTERDSLIGGDGSDRIFAGYGDHVDGGAGGSYGDYLYISFMGAPSGVTADFGLATQTIGGAVITSVENISYIQGSQFGDNLTARSTGTGYSDFNAVSGMGGNDTLTAGYYTGSLFGDDGDDFVDGRPSQYLFVVDGGAGNDTLHAGSGLGASANGGAGDDTIYAGGGVRGGAGNDTIVMQFTYYGGVTYGDEGDDRVTASSSGNRVVGGAGGDTLLGGDAADALFAADAVNNGQAPADDNGLERDLLSGGGGNDTLAAGYGDAVDGGGGTDTLYLSLGGATQGANVDLSGLASGGAVTIAGGTIQGVENFIYLRGSEAADTIRLPTQGVMMTVHAGGGDDVITSQGSSISLLGGAGDDRLVSGAAADTFDGGSGDDTVDYSGAAAAVTVNLQSSSGGGGDTLFSVESAIGSAFADTLTGTAGASTLGGGGGNDLLFGAGGRDLLTGGAGSDTYAFARGDSGVTAGQLDVVSDWSSDDFLGFANGAATTSNYVEASAASYAEALTLANAQIGAGAADFVAVAVGSDVVVFADTGGDNGTADDAVVLMGRTLADVASANLIGGVPGLAPPTPNPPTPNPPTPNPPTPNPPTPNPPTAGVNLTGTSGPDDLQGGANADTLSGGAGNDVLQGRGGDDRLDGGPGTDEAVYLNAPGGVTVNLNLTGAQNTGDGLDTLISIENLSGSNANDVLTGDGAANVLRGWAGADTLLGGGGDDVLDGREGSDLLSGGDGADRLMGHMGADTMSGGAGADIFEFNLTGDAAASSAIGGATGVLDRILDWSSADFLQFWGAATANTGNYREITASGYDAAYSQAQGAYAEFGIEYTAAQVGGDVIVFAPRHNQAVILAGRGLDDISAVNLGPTPGLPAPPPPTGPSNTPTTGNDRITATAGNSEIHAGAGNDTIVGGNFITYLRGDEGNDSISGGAQFDDINGNMGDDTAGGADGDDWVVGGKDNDLLFGDAGNDLVYGNLGADTCEGGNGDDIVRGGQGDDVVRGGAGADFVSGDLGNDTMSGGAGADVFNTFAETGLDRVTDYSVADGDRVLLAPGTQYTVAQVGGDTVISMTGGGQMILVGVTASALPAGWIFGA